MPRALIDTTVLLQPHTRGIVRTTLHSRCPGHRRWHASGGSCPDYVLAETLNGLTTHAGHDAAVDLLDRIEENARFHIDSLNTDAFATGKALFRQHEPLSFVDACIIAYMQTEGLGYLYAFDDDFDAAEDVYRLDTATNPYDPN